MERLDALTSLPPPSVCLLAPYNQYAQLLAELWSITHSTSQNNSAATTVTETLMKQLSDAVACQGSFSTFLTAW